LEPGAPLKGEVSDHSPEVETPTLKKSYTDAPVVGKTYRFQVPESGPWHIDLRSYFFDAYLVLRDAEGHILAEDDDGLVGTHARIRVKTLEAGKPYQVSACALHGKRGAFDLRLEAGNPTPFSARQRAIEDLGDAQARVRALEEVFRPEDPRIGKALNHLGFLYWKAGRFEEALSEMQHALEIVQSNYGEEDERTALALYQVAAQLGRLKRIAEERPFLERSLAILEKIQNPEASLMATVLSVLASVNEAQGLYDKARPLYERALAIREKALGPEHPNTALSLNSLAWLLQEQGLYDKARPLFERALAIREKVLGPEHPATAGSLNNLAELFQSQGHYEEARPLLERALAISEKVLGPEHLGTATKLHNLAGLLRLEGHYEEALPLEKRALAIREKTLGPVSTLTASSLINFAALLQSQGHYEEAGPLFKRALAIREEVLGPGHPDTATALNNLALFLQEQGQYEKAQPLFERALAIREERLGPKHPATAVSLNNLALLLMDEGFYQEARPLYERALAIREETLGPEHPATAVSLNNLALLLMGQGLYREARPLYERALAIQEKALGPDNPSTAIALNNLAVLLKTQGFYEEARPLYERVLAIRQKVLGPENPGTATALNNLAVLLKIQGLYKEARPLYERALAIRKKVSGPEHPLTANALSNLAVFLKTQGLYKEARPLYERALAIDEKVLGPGHPHTIRILNSLALLLRAQGLPEEARPLYEQMLAAQSARLDRELPTMSEAGRFRLLAVSLRPEGFLNCLTGMKAPNLAKALPSYLSWKGKASRIQAVTLRLQQQADTPELRRRKGEIREMDRMLSTLVFLPRDKQDPGHGEKIRKLREKRLELERALNRDLGLEEVLATPSAAEVQAAIPADGVLLDFYAGEEVFAWVLKHEGPPELVPLGKTELLRHAQEAFLRRAGVRGGTALEKEGPDPGMKYADLLWKPLAALVGDAGTVLISPDGFLGELPFGILPDGEGQFLIESHRFAYLSDATRIVGQDGPAADREGSVLAVGDVNYYRREAAQTGGNQSLAMRSRIGDTWPPLTATREEIESLRGLHDQALEWKSPFDQLDGKGATEEAVRAALPGHRYLHLATHGYFEPDDLPSLMANGRKAGPQALGEERRAVGLLPGLLSGLVLAGVNGKPDPERDDGYLSAEEIQYLDLSACDLAVLSACETALGSKRAGEGLQSLRRGFAVAGAKTVVSSLWKVDDRATATLMRHFYENYWQKGMEKLEALHEARLRVLNQNRADYQGDARPSTWGAFVLSGDWR